MKENPGIHLNMAGKTIALQKKALQLYDERIKEQKNWIDLLSRKVNALEKSYGAQYIWKIDRYNVRHYLFLVFPCMFLLLLRNDYKKLVQIRKPLCLVRHFAQAVMVTVLLCRFVCAGMEKVANIVDAPCILLSSNTSSN